MSHGLRIRALELAQNGMEPVENTIKRATAFYEFMTGESAQPARPVPVICYTSKGEAVTGFTVPSAGA